jgi:hypothetical protein
MLSIRRVRTALAAAVLGCAITAGAAQPVLKPPLGDTPFLNGGVTKDEADVMRAQASRYPLEITLARRGEAAGRNDFVADALLRVLDASGRVVVERRDTGPIFLATLPDGAYTIEATWNGQTKSQQVHVAGGRHSQVTFLWE